MEYPEPHVYLQPEVFEIISYFGHSTSDIGAYFCEIADKLKEHQGNYRPRGKGGDATLPNVWVLRDYFPGTAVMFKLTMTHQTPEHIASYYNKMDSFKDRYAAQSAPHNAADYKHRLIVNVKIVKRIKNLHKKTRIDYVQAQKYLMEKSNNILLGDNVVPKSFVHVEPSKPRRMMPKGYKTDGRTNRSNSKRN